MGASADAGIQNRHVLLVAVQGGRSFATRSRSGPSGMVSDRQGDFARQLSTGKDDHPKSEGPASQSSGGLMRTLIASLLCAFVSLSLSTHAAAQPIYAENQVPSRGVDIAYTVIIKNPTSH